MASDPYLIAGSKVLANKLGISDRVRLSRIEHDVSALRLQQLEQSPIAGRFDLAHLEAVHRHIFQDMYAWAGQPRTIRMGRAEAVLDGRSVNYPDPASGFPPDNLDARAEYAFRSLAQDNFLKDLPRAEFAERFARHLSEIWEVHPFRDGNTRATVALMRQLAREAGHPIDNVLSADPRGFRNALVVAAARSDYAPLTALIRQGLGLDSDHSREAVDAVRPRQLKDLTDYIRLKAELHFHNPADRQRYIREQIQQALDHNTNPSPAPKPDKARDDFQL